LFRQAEAIADIAARLFAAAIFITPLIEPFAAHYAIDAAITPRFAAFADIAATLLFAAFDYC
jgi:hypothetical protein